MAHFHQGDKVKFVEFPWRLWFVFHTWLLHGTLHLTGEMQQLPWAVCTERPLSVSHAIWVCSWPGGALRLSFSLLAPGSTPTLPRDLLNIADTLASRLPVALTCALLLQALLSAWFSSLSVQSSLRITMSGPCCPRSVTLAGLWCSWCPCVGWKGQCVQCLEAFGSERRGVTEPRFALTFSQGCLRSSSMWESRGDPSLGQNRAYFLDWAVPGKCSHVGSWEPLESVCLRQVQAEDQGQEPCCSFPRPVSRSRTLCLHLSFKSVCVCLCAMGVGEREREQERKNQMVRKRGRRRRRGIAKYGLWLLPSR